MNLTAVAKSIQPFIRKNSTLESIYKEICSNKSLPFKDFLKPIDLIKVVFMSKKISNGEDPGDILTEFDNGVFLFSTVDFLDDNQTIPCETCFGEGNRECNTCGGAGEANCDDCDGDGEDEEGNPCDYCQGGGMSECIICDGSGVEDCDNCNGKGYEETDEYIPYSINYYVSYDETLKNKLTQKLLINDTEDPEFNFGETFLLAVNEVEPPDGDSGRIKNEFANTTHLLEINTEEPSEDLIYGSNRVIPSGFYDDLDRFM
jgi:RecJ-like exonuclease